MKLLIICRFLQTSSHFIPRIAHENPENVWKQEVVPLIF
jgi:hypothetical protein